MLNMAGWRLALGVWGVVTVFSMTSAAMGQQQNDALAQIEDDPKLPRVLILGDSISIGYTLPVRQELAGKANVHRPKANCGPTIRGLPNLNAWLGEGKWDVIHFNFGLHDLKYIGEKHQVPLEEYEANLEKIVTRLKETGAKLIWCSTTPVPDGKLNPPRKPADVIAYNEAAARVMQRHKIATDDLYSFAAKQLKEIQIPQNVHFTKQGSALLGKEVARQIESALASPASGGGE